MDISHNFRGWKVQDQGTSQIGAWRGPSFRFVDGQLLAISSHGIKREISLSSSFSKPIMDPIMNALHS